MFDLQHTPGVPVAYIDLRDSAPQSAESVTQVIVGLGKLTFVPSELIFDVDKNGKILGVELL